MRRLLAGLALLWPALAFGQSGSCVQTAPSGSCGGTKQVQVVCGSNLTCTCQASLWNCTTAGGGVAPGGDVQDIQTKATGTTFGSTRAGSVYAGWDPTELGIKIVDVVPSSSSYLTVDWNTIPLALYGTDALPLISMKPFQPDQAWAILMKVGDRAQITGDARTLGLFSAYVDNTIQANTEAQGLYGLMTFFGPSTAGQQAVSGVCESSPGAGNTMVSCLGGAFTSFANMAYSGIGGTTTNVWAVRGEAATYQNLTHTGTIGNMSGSRGSVRHSAPQTVTQYISSLVGQEPAIWGKCSTTITQLCQGDDAAPTSANNCPSGETCQKPLAVIPEVASLKLWQPEPYGNAQGAIVFDVGSREVSDDIKTLWKRRNDTYENFGWFEDLDALGSPSWLLTNQRLALGSGSGAPAIRFRIGLGASDPLFGWDSTNNRLRSTKSLRVEDGDSGGGLQLREGADDGTAIWTVTMPTTGITTSKTCTLQADGRLPDDCVGDGVDGGGTITAADTEVLFFDVDNPKGDPDLTWNKTTNTLKVGSKLGVGVTPPLGTVHVKTAASGISFIQADSDDLVIENSGSAGMTISGGAGLSTGIRFDLAGTQVGRLVAKQGGGGVSDELYWLPGLGGADRSFTGSYNSTDGAFTIFGFDSFVEWVARTAPPSPAAGSRRLFADSGNSDHLSVKRSDGTVVDLEVVGTGDLVGPASATDEAVARFDGTTGKLLQSYSSNAPTISDAGAATFRDDFTVVEGSFPKIDLQQTSGTTGQWRTQIGSSGNWILTDVGGAGTDAIRVAKTTKDVSILASLDAAVNVLAGSKLAIGATTLGSAACVSYSTDRLFSDPDCDATWDDAERRLENNEWLLADFIASGSGTAGSPYLLTTAIWNRVKGKEIRIGRGEFYKIDWVDAGLELTTNTRVYCEPGGTFIWPSTDRTTATGMFKVVSTATGVLVDGCTWDPGYDVDMCGRDDAVETAGPYIQVGAAGDSDDNFSEFTIRRNHFKHARVTSTTGSPVDGAVNGGHHINIVSSTRNAEISDNVFNYAHQSIIIPRSHATESYRHHSLKITDNLWDYYDYNNTNSFDGHGCGGVYPSVAIGDRRVALTTTPKITYVENLDLSRNRFWRVDDSIDIGLTGDTVAINNTISRSIFVDPFLTISPPAHCSTTQSTSCTVDDDCPGAETCVRYEIRTLTVSGNTCDEMRCGGTARGSGPKRCSVATATVCTADTDCPNASGTGEECLETCAEDGMAAECLISLVRVNNGTISGNTLTGYARVILNDSQQIDVVGNAISGNDVVGGNACVYASNSEDVLISGNKCTDTDGIAEVAGTGIIVDGNSLGKDKRTGTVSALVAGNSATCTDCAITNNFVTNTATTYVAGVKPGHCATTTTTTCDSSHLHCPSGTCSVTTGTDCHLARDCPVGETCVGAELCIEGIYEAGNHISGDYTTEPFIIRQDLRVGSTVQIGSIVAGATTGISRDALRYCSVTTSTPCGSDADCPGVETCVAGVTDRLYHDKDGDDIQDSGENYLDDTSAGIANEVQYRVSSAHGGRNTFGAEAGFEYDPTANVCTVPTLKATNGVRIIGTGSGAGGRGGNVEMTSNAASTVNLFTFVNGNRQFVLDSTAQASLLDTGVWYVDADDGSAVSTGPFTAGTYLQTGGTSGPKYENGTASVAGTLCTGYAAGSIYNETDNTDGPTFVCSDGAWRQIRVKRRFSILNWSNAPDATSPTLVGYDVADAGVTNDKWRHLVWSFAGSLSTRNCVYGTLSIPDDFSGTVGPGGASIILVSTVPTTATGNIVVDVDYRVVDTTGSLDNATETNTATATIAAPGTANARVVTTSSSLINYANWIPSATLEYKICRDQTDAADTLNSDAWLLFDAIVEYKRN